MFSRARARIKSVKYGKPSASEQGCWVSSSVHGSNIIIYDVDSLDDFFSFFFFFITLNPKFKRHLADNPKLYR